MSGSATPDHGDDPVWRTAWEWLQRAHDGPLTDEEQAELTAWLLGDPAHRQRYDEAMKLWTDASLVPTRYVDPDPDVALDLHALRKAFRSRDGGDT